MDGRALTVLLVPHTLCQEDLPVSELEQEEDLRQSLMELQAAGPELWDPQDVRVIQTCEVEFVPGGTVPERYVPDPGEAVLHPEHAG